MENITTEQLATEVSNITSYAKLVYIQTKKHVKSKFDNILVLFTLQISFNILAN